MKQEELRLECLKLAMRRDKMIAEVIADAELLEDYIKRTAPQTGSPKRVG